MNLEFLVFGCLDLGKLCVFSLEKDAMGSDEQRVLGSGLGISVRLWEVSQRS